MYELFLELDKLKERPFKLTVDYPASLLEADDALLCFPGQVSGEVTFTRVGQDVRAQGTLRTTAQGACARCLKPTEWPLTAMVEELWVKRPPDTRHPAGEDEDVEPDLTHPLTGDRIELAEVFREVLLAELPDRLLCGEECRGLCPGCGANLNQEACQCAAGRESASASKSLPDWKQKLKNLRPEP